ncbi:MAG: ABC transporter substrate-binding protein [Firmicutes bacterium]|nr:ABC transporter substrate-binding protein [Bacillota bacterium]
MKKFFATFLTLATFALILAFSTACGNSQTPATAPLAPIEISQATEQIETTEPTTETAPLADSRTITNIDGTLLTIPTNIETIVSIMPSNTEMLALLGLSDNIIATDTFSSDVAGISQEIAVLSTDNIDMEYIISINPNIVIASDILRFMDDDPLSALSTVGIAVVYMPMSNTISEIQRDVRFLGELMNAENIAESLIEQMDETILQISEISETIANPRTVYMEIEPAPFMFSLGSGTFLNELLEIVGAVNIFGGETGWISVTDEVLLVENPDVIVTNVGWLDNPIEEIAARPGWEVLSAVQNEQIFQIDTNASSRPTPHIINVLVDLALAIYPEYFSQIEHVTFSE